MTRSDKKSKKTRTFERIDGLIKTKNIKPNWRLIKKLNTLFNKSGDCLNNL